MELIVQIIEQPEVSSTGFWVAGTFNAVSKAIEAAKKEMRQSVISAEAHIFAIENGEAIGNPIEVVPSDGHIHCDIEKVRRRAQDLLNKTEEIHAVLDVVARLSGKEA